MRIQNIFFLAIRQEEVEGKSSAWTKNNQSLEENLLGERLWPCLIYIWILLWGGVQLATLMDFPYIHSDELWLMEIGNTMLRQKSFSITEPFFDLYPRGVHPFRWLYNLLLFPFIKVFGAVAKAPRLLSLGGGMLSLGAMDALLKKFNWKPISRLTGVIFLSINIQFIYSAHMGRQETWVLLGMILSMSSVLGSGSALKTATILLLLMGIHPNSFMAGLLILGLLILDMVRRKPGSKAYFKKFLFYMSLGGILYAVVGYQMNPGFLKDYFAFGASLGTDAPPLSRLKGFYWYFYKLFHQIGGTYVLMDIRLYLLITAILLPFYTVKWGKSLLGRDREKPLTAGAFAVFSLWIVSCSFFIIGRYNQTAILFIMPFLTIMGIEFWDFLLPFFFKKNLYLLGFKLKSSQSLFFVKRGAWILLFLICAFNTIENFQEYHRQHFYTLPYKIMIRQLQRVIPPESMVLGNLNTIEAFDPERFFDVRNLGMLSNSSMGVEEYIEKHGIQYVILHEEMDYIYETRPRWEFLYGNMSYYPQLKNFLKEQSTLEYTFENPTYAMRIARFSGTYPWTTSIYRIKP